LPCDVEILEYEGKSVCTIRKGKGKVTLIVASPEMVKTLRFDPYIAERALEHIKRARPYKR